jgi:lipoprotein-anchoring transpeptidase ErfK/SrfK
MFARHSATGLPVVMATLWAIALLPVTASAQDASDWSAWNRPTYRRPPPLVVQPYDDRYDDQSDEQYEPRYQRRRYDWRYDKRGLGARSDRYRRYRNPRYDERYEEFEEPDTAREPEGDAEQNKFVGADGGPRPDIAPATPPVVAFTAPYAAGSIVIDTSARKLYYLTKPGSAFAYPIGVGREGFSWTGSEKVSRVTDWPDWYPPAEMRQRKPELPEKMLGGLNNPLGAKAIYLGTTLYRIHGTNDPKSIGKAESSGCFRMLNAHVLHLAGLVQVGTQVTVVKSLNLGPVAAKRVAPAPGPRIQPQPSRAAPRPRPRMWSDQYDEPYDDYR